jgi:tRNA(His) 5'-end guanylyltransferase
MKYANDSLGTRMKGYENVTRNVLTRRTPVIMRLDGKAFHTFTRGCEKPFDKTIVDTMAYTAKFLVQNIQGAKVAYVQSDEITILLTDFEELNTDAWFSYNIQKMVSIAASMASVCFTMEYEKARQAQMWGQCFPNNHTVKTALFDCRVFNIPKEEVSNNFRWRYQDWLRNSIQMLAQSLYSHKELQGKKTPELHEMCFQKGKNWNDLPLQFKNGTLFCKVEEGIEYITDFNLNSNVFASELFNPILYGEQE